MSDKAARIKQLIADEMASIHWPTVRNTLVRNYPAFGGSWSRIKEIASLYAEARLDALDIDWPGPDAMIEPQIKEQLRKGISALVDAIALGKTAMPES